MSQYSKGHLDRFSRFCPAHRRTDEYRHTTHAT